jgi:hypothetical protein
VTSAIKTSSASDRLQALGLDLPSLGSSSKYVNHRTVDSSIYISGQLPYKDGERWASALSAGTSRWRRREGLRARPRSTRWPSLRRRSGLWTGSGSCRCSFSWPVRRSGVLVLRGAWTQTLATGWRARPGPRPAAGRRCGAVAARVASDAPSTASKSRGVGQYVPGVGEQRQRTGQQAADHLGDEDRPGDGQHDQQRLRCRPVAVIPWECQCPCECSCPEHAIAPLLPRPTGGS